MSIPAYEFSPGLVVQGFTPETLERFADRLGFEPVTRPIACVTTDLNAMAKAMAKSGLRPLVKQTTQQYFRKR